jgi:threonine dehydrogenase-like Zn-dependent dehydrogenase
VRALQLTGPRQAAVVEVPEPSPGPDEVLLRIRASGVCGSDLNAWRRVAGITYPLPPGAPGHEMLGEVVALGAGVDGLAIGESVSGLAWHTLADLSIARADHLVPLPPHLNGTTVLGEPLACAMNVVRRAAFGAGDRVAIVGFGYLAALLVQLLPEAAGPWVAISRRPSSRALALRLGAEAAYDFGEIPANLWDSFPVVIEAAGVQQTLDHATWLTAFGGRLIVAGYHADGPRTVNMQSWNWKGIDVINAHERQPAVYVQALRAAFERLASGSLDLAALHTHTLPLEDAVKALRLTEARPPGFVKALVCP